ncbi:MAG: hypothetical protein PHQ62_02895 [Clostridia bacterium]|nr:hypothetical protein [Clostridia bacterium]
MENNQTIMEQPNEEQVNVTEVKENENVTPVSSNGSIGKFKDTESLLSAYNNLQAEFTRKCQKLSELENEKPTQPTHEELIKNDKTLAEFVSSNQELKDTLLKAYLEELQKNQSPKVISSNIGSGIPLKTPPKPTSLEEAKEIVSTMFL